MSKEMIMRCPFIHISLILSSLLAFNMACPKPIATAPKSAKSTSKPKSKAKKKKKPQKRTIVSVEKSQSRFPCQKHRCEEAYRTFSVRHRAHQRPVGEQQVTDWLKSMKKKKAPKAQGLDANALRLALIDKMNIGFLLNDLSIERQIRTHHTKTNNNLTEEIIEVIDPHVGRFDMLVLIPKKGVKNSAILALHGHGDHPETMARKYMGRSMAQKGHVVVIPRIRAHDCYKDESAENIVAKDLWAHGFSLMGLHVYEALVAQKVIQDRAKLKIEKWGLIGHSGGSSLANLLPRLTHNFQAKVIDYYVDFNNRCGPERVHCETFGPLFPLSNDINNEKTASIPFLKVPYSFKKYKSKIEAFFAKHL